MDLLTATLSASEKAALFVSAGSLIFSLLSLIVTVVALVLTANGIRDAQAAARDAKALERETAADQRGYELLQVAAGKGTPFLNEQLLAISMLAAYPQHYVALRALLDAYESMAQQAAEGSNWGVIAAAMRQTLARQGQASSP
jgi:hypothetical protein